MKIEEAIRQSKFESARQKALVNLIYTSNWLQERQNVVLKPFGIRVQHYNVLRILRGKRGEPVSMREIKEVMLDKSPDLTRLVDKLANKEWVSRELCRENRRKMDVAVTEKGLEVLREIERDLYPVLDDSMRLGEGDAEKLSGLLDKLRT